MNFIFNVIEKIIFGALLLLFFQIPILADHYLQYVSGYYEATSKQVEAYKQNAMQHQYADVYAMIDDLSQNTNSVVRTDAEQKRQTMHEYEELTLTIAKLKEGNIVERAWVMFNPAKLETLKKVGANFKPGIPLSVNDIIFSIIAALLLSAIIVLPLRLLFRKKRPSEWNTKSRSSY
ncbi:MAG: DUF2937 family protein [Gammaproteobacteria bacterium]|nr:MAG: DUF2937 family protein [Gammaproteobacteria bacterium]